MPQFRERTRTPIFGRTIHTTGNYQNATRSIGEYFEFGAVLSMSQGAFTGLELLSLATFSPCSQERKRTSGLRERLEGIGYNSAAP